jgi:hypothetical protein
LNENEYDILRMAAGTEPVAILRYIGVEDAIS